MLKDEIEKKTQFKKFTKVKKKKTIKKWASDPKEKKWKIVKLKKKTQTQIRQINKLKHDDIENKIQF